jgi:HptB-dependent secretion and biofilm anti anti-sigma factor
MKMKPTISTEGNVITLSIAERLDFSAHDNFCEAAQHGAAHRGAKYVIDLGRTERIYDSGIGLLLMLRKRAGGGDADIRIVNCRPELKDALTACDRSGAFWITEH